MPSLQEHAHCQCGCCASLDNVADPRDCKGFHQIIMTGRHDRLHKAYAQLAGIEIGPPGLSATSPTRRTPTILRR